MFQGNKVLPPCSGCLYLFCSFELWFDIDSISEAENVVAAEREQNILSMLHQVSSQAGITRQSSVVENFNRASIGFDDSLN